MALEVAHRARTDRGGLEIGRAADHRDAGRQPELGRGTGRQRREHVGGADQIGQLRPRRFRPSASSSGAYAMRAGSRLSVSQCITIESNVAAARPVSLRLSQSFGSRYFHVARGDVGPLGLEPEDVRDRVLARVRRRAAGEPDERAQLARVVPGRPSRRPPTSARICSAPRESIQMIASWSGSPLASTATVPDHCDVTDSADDRVDGCRGALQQPTGRAHDARPPVGGSLLRSPARRQLEVDGFELTVDVLTRRREQRDLRARRSEIDREDVLGRRSLRLRAGACRGRRSRPAAGRARGSGRGCCACCRRRSARR